MPAKIKKSTSIYKTFMLDHQWHTQFIGFLVGILMIAVYIWIASGCINLLTTLYHCYPDTWSHGAEKMIKDIVMILASLELIRIFQSYLLIGRVKVTFILDVALVVLIGELISFWYREFSITEIILSIFVISTLIILRIVTTRYSPDGNEY